jgi:hypothetical protein
MADRQMELGIIRRLGQDLTVQRQGLRIVAESRAYRRASGAIDPVVRISRKEFVHLLARADVLVAVQERDRILVAGGMIVRCEHQHLLEQELGIVHDVEFHADLREQPHTLDVIAMSQQVLAHELLGRRDLAVREHAVCGEDLRRQVRELRGLSGGVVRVGMAAGHAE